jgi:hypothetical protein
MAWDWSLKVLRTLPWKVAPGVVEYSTVRESEIADEEE